MDTKTTIRKIFAGNKIIVPKYQRAYSWETPNDKSWIKTHTNVFLNDLIEYKNSNAKTPYYFGHFLFAEKSNSEFHVIDGQQRLTTTIIFLSTLFKRLKKLRNGKLKEEEQFCYEDILKRGERINFYTVDYDNLLFRDYVVNQSKNDKNGLKTSSAKRIVKAFDFFNDQLAEKDEKFLVEILDVIINANCTTHIVTDEAEAIQMFIFQNNRGKSPSSLEIIKAQFMYNIHLYGNNQTDDLLGEIKERFEEIYKSISLIEANINEDDVLTYTLRVFYNSLYEGNAIEKINKELANSDCVDFIKNFTFVLAESFEKLKLFYTVDEKKYLGIHSLIKLGSIATAIPFILKAYKFDLPKNEIERLSLSLANLVLRHRLIGTRADMTSRINGVFREFTIDNSDIQPIINRINRMKTETSYWWGHWNNDKLFSALQGDINHGIAKYILWNYENYIRKNGKSGYKPIRLDEIEKPELEHIAPQKEPDKKPHGYGKYDDEFYREFLNNIGNFLLLSKSHNSSIGNNPFYDKINDYDYLFQQREIKKMTKDDLIWDKNKIQKRKDIIIKFVVDKL